MSTWCFWRESEQVVLVAGKEPRGDDDGYDLAKNRCTNRLWDFSRKISLVWEKG